MQKGATAVDPLIDLVRQRTDELHRVAESVRRGRAATTDSPEPATVVVTPAMASSTGVVTPATSDRRAATATCQLVGEPSGIAPAGARARAGANTHRAA
jgi:hypothetical protein